MSNLSVFLTTTKYIDFSSSDQLKKLNVPVCACQMSLILLGVTSSEQEKIEFDYSKTCKNMAKFVIVNSEKNFLYVGDDSEGKNDTGLVEYEDLLLDEFSKEFFKRYEETKNMMFEFVVTNSSNKPAYCLKGLWVTDHWYNLDIRPTNNFIIIDKEDFYGISKN